jgi:hypothetical protein
MRLVPLCAWLLIAALGLSGVLEFGTTHGPLGSAGRAADAYLAQAETKAVEAFAVARTINAAVSFLKSADLSAVFAQVAPLQVLEPLDDLAKQFSDVMVISIVAIQLQRLFLRVSQAWALGIVLPAGCVLIAASLAAARVPALRLRLSALGRTLVVIALCARFVVVAAAMVGDGLTTEFLAGDLNATMERIDASGGHLDRLTLTAGTPSAGAAPQTQSAPPSLMDRLADDARKAVGNGASLVSGVHSWIPDRASINAFVVDLPGQIVRAISIFLLQTILTPLCVSLLLFALLRSTLQPDTRFLPARTVNL